MGTEVKQSFTPDNHQYWRETVKQCIEFGKADEILCVGDYIEGALVNAFKLGRSMEQEYQEQVQAEIIPPPDVQELRLWLIRAVCQLDYIAAVWKEKALHPTPLAYLGQFIKEAKIRLGWKPEPFEV